MAYLSHSTSSYRASGAHAGFLGRLTHMITVAKTRRDLRNLDASALRDIGVSRAEAEAEAARPIWDAPQIWRK